MSVEATVTEAEPVERFVLLAVARFERRGETPVRSYEVLGWCQSRTDDLSGDVIGEVTRNVVIRSLESLAGTDLVDVEEETSPVGKGRPSYSLAAPVDEVLSVLVEDGHVGEVAAEVRDD